MFLSIIAFTFSCVKQKESENFRNALSNIENGFLLVQTYEGSNQVVHPDIIWDNMNQKFWLAITPYPDFQDAFENPCLYHSENGMTFLDSGISNPLVEAPNTGFNCDPDIFYDMFGKKHIIYVETKNPLYQILHILHLDKNNSVARDTLWFHAMEDPISSSDFILSPTVVRIHNAYGMYYVNLIRSSQFKNEIKFGLFSDLNNLNHSSFEKLDVDIPLNYNPWHIDVFHTGKFFIMILNGFYGGKYDNNGGSLTSEYSIQVLTSKNGINWHNHGDFLGHGNSKSLEICTNTDPFFKYVYRGTGLYSENLDLLVLWYSYVTTDNVWKLAVHKFYTPFK